MGCRASLLLNKMQNMQQYDGPLRTAVVLGKRPEKSMFAADSLIGEGGFGRVVCSMFLPTKKWCVTNCRFLCCCLAFTRRDWFKWSIFTRKFD